jgi:hydroxypyruvate isomerase
MPCNIGLSINVGTKIRMTTSSTISRRRFLSGTTTSAAALVATGLGWTGQTRAVGAAEPAKAIGQPKLSACIEALFTNLSFEKRLEAVKAVGLDAFEFWGWRNRDLDALARKKEELGLEVAAFSCDTGGALVAAGSSERFLPALQESIAAAQKLRCARLIVTVGNERKEVSRVEQHRNIVAALKAGAPLCEKAGITLCLEPLNVLVNHRGYYLATSAEGFEILEETGSPSIKLLFDIYHQQITEGNLIENISRSIGRIGHFHVADVPGRHHPGTGEINYRNVFAAIARAGYGGFLGLEMWPTVDHSEAVRQTMALLADALAG